ncbi:class I SAM-dependent methyltransferase [Luteibaculum oceani]|uniref:Methyltransferase domain-containing protein n=1 Tax=Luteibaculum oceani TaxID=1294296 RepID=A0A5C6UV22_9FLAO|nr:methyltransferase domain-containing protein [Luteibaculum oceani]TXC77127.1 methyltransferase domain-containing protein [Luteibaculum oceani]
MTDFISIGEISRAKSVEDLLDPRIQILTDYNEPEDIKRFLFIADHVKELNLSVPKVLDVGCGNGHISIGLARLGCEVTGIDIDAQSIATANEHYGELANFKVLDVAELGKFFSPEHFDLIVCSEVLEHLEQPTEMVKHLFPFLSKTGKLIVTTPNGFGPREVTVTKPVQKLYKLGFGRIIAMVKRLMGYRGATAQSSNPDLTHIQFFRKDELIEVVKQGGALKLIEFGNANYVEKAFPQSLWHKSNMEKKAKDCLRADQLPNEKASGWNTAWKK